MAGDAFGSRWPVGRKGDQVGSEQCQAPRRLGKCRVVADIHAHIDASRLVNVERSVSVIDMLVDAEKRQMSLPVTANDSERPSQHGRIENPVAIPFQHSENGEDIHFCTDGRKTFRRRTRHWLSKR